MRFFDANLREMNSNGAEFSEFADQVMQRIHSLKEKKQKQEISSKEHKKEMGRVSSEVDEKLKNTIKEYFLKRADELVLFQLAEEQLPLVSDAKGKLYSLLADVLIKEKPALQPLRLPDDLQNLFRAVSRGISSPDLSRFPNSCFLTFQFTLAKPLLTKDDDPFHLLENPIRQDWVFKLPVFEASSWKGCLNSAVTMRIGRDKE